MTPARFQTIEEIFLAALEQEPDQIGAFLDTACGGDAVLRREVDALLASDQRAGRFIEKSTVGLATKVIQNQQAHSLLGQTIGHYKISESIGTGGMGEVYLATDIVAGRKAALKLLPMCFTGDVGRLKRFQQEEHAVVALNHPNILTVYEIGEDHSIHYIASELIEGETLRQRLTRGPMQLSEAVDIAIQVASALAAAHDADVIHRDIKPENIMLRPDGYVKVLDFGIAKLAEQELPATMPRDEALLMVETNVGLILGTVRYMSPEQTCGAPVDKRTDIWSLGVVLYEMVTGQTPFTGDTPQDVMSSILEKEPKPLTRYIAHAPAELQQIINKTLRKDRGQRYDSAHELLQALKDLRRKLEAEFERAAAPLWLRWARSPAALVLVLTIAALALALPFYLHRNPTTSVPPDKSIAVLPFENLGEDKANAYFADGIHEEILTRLAKIADLKVISRTSTQRYQSKPGNLAEIAKQLGVANILEGSVQKAGDQVRVNVQLVNAQNDSHLWAETYDRKLTDIFGVESEIAKGIAESLQAKLTGREEQELAVKPTNNPEAYDAYLRGVAFQARSFNSGDLLRKAIDSYERAVQLDPNFALAWARLSRVDADLYFRGWDTTAARRDAAKRALENAQKLQPSWPETQLALGYYQDWVLRDYALAKTTFKLVSKMLPGSSEVPFALGDVTRREGHWDQSIAHFEQALALDPRNVELLLESAGTYTMLRQFPAALKLYDRALDITPNDPDLLAAKANGYQAEGNLQEAAKLLKEVNAQTASTNVFQAVLAQLRLERHYGEAIQLVQARLVQFHFTSEIDKGLNQDLLAFHQRLAGDTVGTKATAEDARNTLQPLCRNQPDNAPLAVLLSQAYAALGEKDSALKEAERAIMLLPSQNQVGGRTLEESLAIIQTILGENSRAISTLTHLLQTPYFSLLYVTPVTPALLRLDPIWDPLRNDPRFQELVEKNAPEKSIAVLPFENRSEDKANAYLAGGIQDEILTRLSKIADLKVISRTSTQHYKSAPENLPEIAKQLGVAHILEGSVQKSGDAVRVNVQLIKAANDSHLWADTFDRKLSDIFSVESDVAKAIADQLRAKLTGREEQAISAKPTDNVEAYDAYLRGLAFEGRSVHTVYSPDLLAKAAGFYERAVELDPKFALAWARLSRVNAHLYFEGSLETTSAQRDAARRALEEAQKLEPNSPETLLALGYYQYWVLRDYGAAKTTFGRVSKMLPNSSEVPMALGRVARRGGHWDESVAYLEQGLALDPRNVEWLLDLAETYGLVRQFSAALKLYDRVLDISPNDPDVMTVKASIYQAQGNLQGAAKLLSEIDGQTPSEATFVRKITQLRFERNYGEVVRQLQARLAQFHYDSDIARGDDQVRLALIQCVAGDWAGAKVTAKQSRDILERLYRDESHMPRGRAELAADLSQAYAVMGEKDSALKTAADAVMLLPRAKDPKLGPGFEENLALIQMMVGENDQAISTLAQLLQTSYNSPLYGPPPITPALLRLDPLWDPIRNDPRFQELVAEEKP